MEYNFKNPVSDRSAGIALYTQYYYPAYFAAYTFTEDKHAAEMIAQASIEYLDNEIGHSVNSRMLEQKLAAFIKQESLKHMIENIISRQNIDKS